MVGMYYTVLQILFSTIFIIVHTLMSSALFLKSHLIQIYIHIHMTSILR
jgi:hypothetical protein